MCTFDEMVSELSKLPKTEKTAIVSFVTRFQALNPAHRLEVAATICRLEAEAGKEKSSSTYHSNEL